MLWDDEHRAGDYPRWTVYLMGVVTGLILSWIQYACWMAR